ncbi:MAG: DUF6089 family protein [Flavobacteriales bacterium]|nr:DUF6089 family protein [Flavobacteriales bacterium]
MKFFRIIFFVAALCSSADLLSQVQITKWDKSQELGLVFGTSYYLGEVNPYRHFGTRLKPSGGLTFRQNMSKRWSLKAGLLFGNVLAYDSDSKDGWIQNRNLHFKNQFWEGSLQFELNYFNYQIGKSSERISPYLFAGLGYYSMKPQAEFKGVWYDLQPIGTEGQGIDGFEKKYNTAGMCVPFGAGLKMNLFAIFALSFEWGIRKTWTDYFDDISANYADPDLLEDESGDIAIALADQSLLREGPQADNGGMQRGDPGRKDWYSFATVSLNIRIDKPADNCFK